MKLAFRYRIDPLMLCVLALLAATAAEASSSGMPWDSKLDRIWESLNGNVARVIGALIIMATGFTLSSGEGGRAVKTVLWVVFGLSIAFTASTFGLTFLGFAGGLTV